MCGSFRELSLLQHAREPWPRAPLQQVLDQNGHVADPPARCVENGILNGSGRPGHGNFPDALCADVVEQRIRLVDEAYVNLADIGIHRDNLVGKVVVEPAAIARVDLRCFAQRGTDRPYDAAP